MSLFRKTEAIRTYFIGLLLSLIAFSSHVQANQCSSLFSISQTYTPISKLAVSDFKAGDSTVLASGLKVYFEESMPASTYGIVFKVRDELGHFYALKYSRKYDEKSISHFSEEKTRVSGAQTAGFTVAPIIESNTNYYLRKWVDGELAQQWVIRWVKAGFPRDDVRFQRLKVILAEAARRGLYTFDLNRKNLIWAKDDWIVIDNESTTKEFTPEQVLERYHVNIAKSWAADFKSTYEENRSVRDQIYTALSEK